MTSTNKEVKFFTTKGTSAYAVVHSPQSSKMYPEKGPSYQITVKYKSLNDPEAKKLEKNLKEFKVKKTLKEVEDRDGNPTGEVSFTFDRKAFIDDSQTPQNPPLVVDKYCDTISKDTLIGNGSEVIVEYNFRPYEEPSGKQRHAATFRAVQVVTLVPYTRQVTLESTSFTPLATKEEKTIEDQTNSPW